VVNSTARNIIPTQITQAITNLTIIPGFIFTRKINIWYSKNLWH